MFNLIIKEKSFDKKILKNINIKFNKNKIYGLVGLNGSGKTTLLNILLGLDTDFEGSISHIDIERNEDIFYIPSDFYLPEYLTGEEYCIYLHELKDKELDKVVFDKLCTLFKLENDKGKLIENYSYGMKKKIQFITGILMKCKLYIFDELTSGLDIETILLIEKILLSKKATFVISSHEIDFIERVSDEVLLINNKTIEYISGDIRSQLTDLSKVEEQYETIKDIF